RVMKVRSEPSIALCTFDSLIAGRARVTAMARQNAENALKIPPEYDENCPSPTETAPAQSQAPTAHFSCSGRNGSSNFIRSFTWILRWELAPTPAAWQSQASTWVGRNQD